VKLVAHRFETPDSARILAEYDEAIQKRIGWLSKGEGDEQSCCQQITTFSRWIAAILLALGHSDADVGRYFGQALGYGLRSLGAIGTTKSPRVYDVLVEHSDAGVRVIYEHEIVPRSREPQKITVADFSIVLALAVCFGDRPEMDAVGGYPEDRYRNPDIVAGEEFFAYLRAWKSLLHGDERSAVQEMTTALEESPSTATRKQDEAFLLLLSGDSEGFWERVAAMLRLHKKRHEKRPADPDGFVSFGVLMLLRIAIDRGLAVQELPYVPVRLLPNFARP
jgi:hypothetical protein